MRVLNGRSVHTVGKRLVDEQGRTVFLSGINLVHKGTRRADGSFDFTPWQKTSIGNWRTWD